MTTADEVREYALVALIKPARRKGKNTVSFSCADIHTGMGLQGYYRLVCSAIDAHKFQDYASVTLAKRSGQKETSSYSWAFELIS